MSGGTAFTFLHRHVGAPAGCIGQRLRLKAGSTSLISALAERARAAGVVIETATAVRRLTVRDDRIAGVQLASGEELGALVKSYRASIRTAAFLSCSIRCISIRSSCKRCATSVTAAIATKVLLALEDSSAAPAPAAGSMIFAPSIRYVERAYDAVKYGRSSAEPFVELRFPSARVAVLHVQFTPYGCARFTRGARHRPGGSPLAWLCRADSRASGV